MRWVRRPAARRVDGLAGDERPARQVRADRAGERPAATVLFDDLGRGDDPRSDVAVVRAPHDDRARVGARRRAGSDDGGPTDSGEHVVATTHRDCCIVEGEMTGAAFDEHPRKVSSRVSTCAPVSATAKPSRPSSADSTTRAPSSSITTRTRELLRPLRRVSAPTPGSCRRWRHRGGHLLRVGGWARLTWPPSELCCTDGCRVCAVDDHGYAGDAADDLGPDRILRAGAGKMEPLRLCRQHC